LGREQYSLKEGWSVTDIKEILAASISLIQGKEHNFLAILLNESLNLIDKRLINNGAKLVPSARGLKNLERKDPGIRAQLVHLPSKTLEQDFVVKNLLNSTHILNAVSPGWTSSIPFGKYVGSRIIASL
jgi:hypothetical protein